MRDNSFDPPGTAAFRQVMPGPPRPHRQLQPQPAYKFRSGHSAKAPRMSADEPGDPAKQPKARQVVPSHEKEDARDQRQPGAEPVIKGARRQRAPTDCLDGVKDQVSTIQDRDGKQS